MLIPPCLFLFPAPKNLVEMAGTSAATDDLEATIRIVAHLLKVTKRQKDAGILLLRRPTTPALDRKPRTSHWQKSHPLSQTTVPILNYNTEWPVGSQLASTFPKRCTQHH